MTDSFYDFSNLNPADQTFEEEDDTEYDALNSETFGEDLPASDDWEEIHEQLASELEKCSLDDENDLSERIASYILDDEGEEVGANATSFGIQQSQKQPVGPSQGPAKWWLNGVPPSTGELSSKPSAPMEAWWQKPQTTSFNNVDTVKMPPKKILTVEELEEKMRQEAAEALGVGGSRPVPRHAHSSLPVVEDLGREMHQVNMPNQIQNGNYGRGRGILARGRYRPEIIQEQPYHAVHHPYPPYGPSSGMIRPPLRHPGQAYRRYDRRMILQQVPGPRPPRPNHPYFPNQQPHYGRMGPLVPADEYAGLMNQQEKQWLASIQMLQLNTHQPFQEDYYFIMYQQRQGNSGRKMCGSHSQKREQVPQKPASTYMPLQFENSLGKLQVGSVNAPRKIIDMELVESLDHNTKQSDKKSKQILLEIEEMYNYIIQIEDEYNPLNTSKKDIDLVAIQDKLLTMFAPEGKLIQIMSIRKGKKLVLRMLSNLLFPTPLLHRLMTDLVPITRKDTEHNMLLFLPAIRNYLQGVPLKTLVEITTNYDNQFLLSNKFTVSVMANLIERADQVRAECVDEGVLNEWNMFLIRLLESTRLWNQTERPVVAVDRNVLIQHLTPILDQVSPAQANALLLTLQSATIASVAPTAPSSELPKQI